jgi:molybdenum cofactor cytidylyltransferase
MKTMAESAASPLLGAVILAAGRSSRMGTDKATLRLGGRRTFLEMILDSLAIPGRPMSKVVVLGENLDSVKKLIIVPGITLVQNLTGGDQFSSLKLGLQAIFELNPLIEVVFVCPVDQPLIPVGLIPRLIDAYDQHHSSAVIPTWNERGGHPMLLGRELAIHSRDSSPTGGLQEILGGSNEVLHLPVPWPEILTNLNTPAEVQTTEARFFPEKTT